MEGEKGLIDKRGILLPQSRFLAVYLDRLIFSGYDISMIDAVNRVGLLRSPRRVAFTHLRNIYKMVNNCIAN